MKKKSSSEHIRVETSMISKKLYKKKLHKLQIELVKLQRHFISCDEKILILLEGRDAAGKDGAIKRIVQHLSPRETRVVALGKPSDHDRESWYLQRYVQHLPASQELVIFNRSWYNRAGVERVMGFCTPEEYENFMRSVVEFERLLIRSGIKLFKYYLDISKEEQKKRLEDRRKDPLKQWKISPIDDQAIERWESYSLARNEMLTRTHDSESPWTVVRANNKRLTRISIIQDLLSKLDYTEKDEDLLCPDPSIISEFTSSTVDKLWPTP